MRISDWSSDVCSSDLPESPAAQAAARAAARAGRPVRRRFGCASAASFPERWTSNRLSLPHLPDLFLPDERGRLVNAFAGRIDGHGHRHVLHLELVDRFHAQVFKPQHLRSDEHTSELQSLIRISYAVSCLK